MAVALAAVALLATGVSLAGSKCKLSAAKDGKCCANLAKKYETQGWLGIEKEYNEDGTFTVAAVVPRSPAARAGIQAGDVVEAFNGTTLTPETAEKICSSKTEIGKTIALGIRRGDDRLTLSAELVKIPETVLTQLIAEHKQEEEHDHDKN
jgi:C-terminal processing protease CtpA/Prc